METITPEYETIEIETPGRRRKITKFALAGVAVLGVGAALTSAAWSDNVLFGGSAGTGNLDLQGSGTAGSGAWEATGNGNDAVIVIPGTAFTNVGPDVTDTHWIEIRNNGTVDVKLDDIDVQSASPDPLSLFGGTMPAEATLGSITGGSLAGPRVLAPGDEAQIEIVVTGDENWDNGDYTGRTGTLTVNVHGTSDLASTILPGH